MKSVKQIAYYAVSTLEACFIAFVALLAVINVYMLFQYKVLSNPVPTVFGYSYVNVLSGSMEPTLKVGDLAICKEKDNYVVGDAVLFEDEGYLVLHRVAGTTDDGMLVTKGDANNVADEGSISPDDVYGKMVYSFKGMGSTMAYLSSRMGAVWAILAALFIFLGLDALRDLLKARVLKDIEREEPDEGSEPKELDADTVQDNTESDGQPFAQSEDETGEHANDTEGTVEISMDEDTVK